jgi:ubiquitin-protein ligase
MIGPKNTPYAGGKFTININFGQNYMFSPIKILFVTKIFHPNVNQESGEVAYENLNNI